MDTQNQVINALAVDSPLKGTNSLTAKSSMSATHKHRVSYLVHLFNDSTDELVNLIEGRGRNSWSLVNRKINNLEQASYETQRYYDALYDNFEVGEIYSSSDIIGITGDVRRDLRMDPYISRLRTNCENDFFGLFIVQEVSNEEIIDSVIKKKVVGYKPLFKLRPEDK
ncbi:hypothetical protein [Mucilaginibacter sp.]|uniref:hypothetical protein n=1 Tax=Mucilaginibacter sp. TaxID=1882438 RepID=UPI00284421C3|nr:hypothetical protein [Mucilaginibacter sp.]MDR3695591.1 hypothetical protein [Mucilaginibacter sp.]